MVGSMGSNIFISGKVSCSYHVKMLSTGQVCYLGLWVSIVGGSIFYGGWESAMREDIMH